MLRSGSLLVIFSVLTLAAGGCEATAEDIERWKGTQRGPAKITSVIVDDRYSDDLRAQAAVALVEIVHWDNFNAAFQKMGEQDRQSVIHAMVPRLRALYEQGAAEATEEGPTEPQVLAKDAMIAVYAWAAPEDQVAMQAQLLDWITSDFNAHYLPGRESISTIAEKIGAPAAAALAKILVPDNALVLDKITELVARFGDDDAKRLASENLAKTGRAMGDTLRPSYWKAAAQVCGDPVRRFTLEFTARRDTKVDVESQQNALICVMTGSDIEGCSPQGCTQRDDIDPLLAVAQDEQQDERVRAAAYDVLREHAPAEYADRFLALIDDADARYRATGIDIAGHLAGGKILVPALEKIGASREHWPWMLKNSRTGGEEYGLCNMGLGVLEQAKGIRDAALAGLTHGNPYVRGGSANMLGIVGTTEDVPRLEKLVSDGARLKGWEPEKVGAQAKQAIERIQDSKRPDNPSARRGRACGLDVR